MDWLPSQVSTCPKPFLGYIHLLPPHGPYTTRQEFAGHFKDNFRPTIKPIHPIAQDVATQTILDEQRRLYDESIAYIDAEFGRLFNTLKESGLLQNTVLILTSDHGELFERGILSHITAALFEPIIHIPLLIWMPGQTTRQDYFDITSATDILPTLLHLSRLPIPNQIEGRVLPGFTTQRQPDQGAVFAVEAKNNSRHRRLRQATISIRKDQYKLIHYIGYPQYHNVSELFDIQNDPEEINDLSKNKSQLTSQLKNELLHKLEVNENRLFR